MQNYRRISKDLREVQYLENDVELIVEFDKTFVKCTTDNCPWEGPQENLNSHTNAAHPYEFTEKELNHNAIYRGCSICGSEEHSFNSCPDKKKLETVHTEHWRQMLCEKCGRFLPLYALKAVTMESKAKQYCAECLAKPVKKFTKDEVIDYLRKGGKYENIANNIED